MAWRPNPSQWRRNGRDSVSNHQPHDCLLNLFSDADQRKHQSSASLAFVRRIHRGPMNSPHKRPVTRKVFPFDDVIMQCWITVSYTLRNIHVRGNWILIQILTYSFQKSNSKYHVCNVGNIVSLCHQYKDQYNESIEEAIYRIITSLKNRFARAKYYWTTFII